MVFILPTVIMFGTALIADPMGGLSCFFTLVVVVALCAGAMYARQKAAQAVTSTIVSTAKSAGLSQEAAEGVAIVAALAVGEGVDADFDLEPVDIEAAGADSAAVDIETTSKETAYPDPTYYGTPSEHDGDPRTNPVSGYVREDGSRVDPYWRGDRDDDD